MAYIDVFAVVVALVFQRLVYSRARYTLDSRPASVHKNHFFASVFNFSYILIALALFTHIAFPFFAYETLLDWVWRFSCGILCLIGGGLVLREGRRILGEDYSDCKDSYLPQAMRTRGIYAYIRHPIYSGNLMMSLGTTIMLPGFASFLFLGVLTASYQIAIKREEKDLLQHFELYGAYLKSTGAFFPVLTIKKFIEVEAVERDLASSSQMKDTETQSAA